MARKSSILFLLLLLPLCFPAKITSPQLVTAAEIVLSENGTVTVEGGSLYDISINLSIPAQRPYQKVESDEPPLYDSEANAYLRIYSGHPSNPFTYSRTVGVQTAQRLTSTLPQSYSVPQEYSKYLSSTQRTQAGSPAIRAAALAAIANASTPFGRVARLATFVHSYVDYDEQMIGKERDALWVLQNGRGVCIEYATLFVALARSVGIPARYVTGYVYSDRFSGWLGHAWAEAYIGEWVPVDPTWFEAGALDALHVEAGKYAEISREPSLLATVSDASAKITWDTSGRSGARANNIATRSIDVSQPEANFTLGLAAPELYPGGTTIAFLSMRGTDYRVIPVSLAECSGEESVSVAEPDKYLVLEPGRTSTAVWVLSASDSLSDEYVYSCPLTLNSPYLEIRQVQVKVDPRKDRLPQYSAALQEKALPPGSPNRVLLSLPQSRRGKEYYVVTPTSVSSRMLYGGAESMPFAADGQGGTPVFVAGEGGDYKVLYYDATSSPDLSIDSFFVPQYAVQGAAARAAARISARSYPADFSLEFAFGNQSARTAGLLNGSQEFAFEFFPDEAGAQQASLILGSQPGSTADEENSVVLVVTPPAVSLSEITVSRDSVGLLATLGFSFSGEPLFASIEVGRNSYPIANLSQPLSLRLRSGTYSSRIRWSDFAGNNYTKEQAIEVRTPAGMEQEEETGTGVKSPPPLPVCPSALALFALGAAVAFSRR